MGSQVAPPLRGQGSASGMGLVWGGAYDLSLRSEVLRLSYSVDYEAEAQGHIPGKVWSWN